MPVRKHPTPVRFRALVLALLLAAISCLSPAGVRGEEPEAAPAEVPADTAPASFDDGVPRCYTPADLPVYEPVYLENLTPEPLPLDGKTPYAPHPGAFLPDNGGYVDSTLSVKIDTRTLGKTKVLFAWVTIADPSQLRTTTYRPFPSKAIGLVDAMAKRERAVLALNADWFMSEEKVTRGVIYRNGKLLREKDFGVYDALVIDDAGDLHIVRHAAVEDLAPWEGHILQSFVFGPGLVIDGELVQVYEDNELDRWAIRHSGGNKATQRCVLCQMDTLSYLVIVSEGPEQVSGAGFKINEMAQLAYDMGAVQAFNLDGGSSAWLVLGEKRVNTRDRNHKKRLVGDMLYFVTAEPDAAGDLPE
ncbi:MAG: phosphodiester glycosidase family protein [Clostridia bacterium]|nr:phosphodiester glycosidase family protein [Clostridia bacterium]